MGNSGKTSTIFLAILSVFFVCTTGISVVFFLKEAESRKKAEFQFEELQTIQAKVQAELQETKKQLQLAEEKKKEAEGVLNNLRNELQVEQDLKEALKKRNQELTQAIEASKKEKEQLREEMSKDLNEAEQRIAELQQKVDLLTKQKEEGDARRAELEQQYNNLKSQTGGTAVPLPSAAIDGERASGSASVAAISQESSDVLLGTIVVNPEAGMIPSGKIINIDQDAEFMIISLGTRDGVKPDSLLSVFRGTQYLGDVKATRVLDDMAAVDFVLPLNSQVVSKDDHVVLKQ